MGILDSIMPSMSQDIGIDLGTANTLVYVRGKGIVLREPSIVAVNQLTKEVLEVGSSAQQMLGRTPENITAIRPLRDGVIADFDLAEAMLKYFIKKVHNRSFMIHPRMVIGIPSGATGVERRAVIEAAAQAGAREAYLIEEPMAAAIGAGLPVAEPTGSVIVDIGGGTTEIAVLSFGGIVVSKSIRVAGDKLTASIAQYMRLVHNISIGERTAEDIKISIGSAFPLKQELTMQVKGINLVSGLPRTIEIHSEEVRSAMNEPLNAILEAIRETFERTPPELAADILDRGICIAGGGALLRGIDELITKETEIPTFISQDPLSCVGLGAGRVLEEFDKLKQVLGASAKM